MRFNEKEAASLARRPGQLEGRLQYRAPPGTFRDTGFRERFFRLVNNLLFYFRISEFGQIDFTEPVGVIVLENYSVRVEIDSELSFAFGILFLDEPDKRHIFTARSDTDANDWVNHLRQASYQHWKDKLQSMQCNISALRDVQKRGNRNVTGASASSSHHRSVTVTDEMDLLDLGDGQKSRLQQPPRHNPFLSSPKPPPRSHSPSNNNNDRNNDLIKW